MSAGQLKLVEPAPGTPQALHPRLLAATKTDYQLAHAKDRRAYLTSALFPALWRWWKRPRAPIEVPWQFKLVNGAYYYHGTTLEDLERILDSGGIMKPDVSQFSMLARDSVSYGYSRQDNVGRPAAENPQEVRYPEQPRWPRLKAKLEKTLSTRSGS